MLAIVTPADVASPSMWLCRLGEVIVSFLLPIALGAVERPPAFGSLGSAAGNSLTDCPDLVTFHKRITARLHCNRIRRRGLGKSDCEAFFAMCANDSALVGVKPILRWCLIAPRDVHLLGVVRAIIVHVQTKCTSRGCSQPLDGFTFEIPTLG